MRLIKLLLAAVLALTTLPLTVAALEPQPAAETLPPWLSGTGPAPDTAPSPTPRILDREGSIVLVEINAWDQGWYDSEGRHNPLITNYGVGEDDEGIVIHNWFVYSLPIEGTITAATLSAFLPNNGYMSPHPYETWALYDVTTEIDVLVAGGPGHLDVFEDLGSGTGYGQVTVTHDTNYIWVDVPLNGDALAALNAALGGPVAIGGALATLDDNHENIEVLFAWSGSVPPKLILEVSFTDPDVDVQPRELSASQCPDTVTTQPLTICNLGGGPLDWTLTELPEPGTIPWLSAEPTGGSVPAGDCQEITITFDSAGLQPGTRVGSLQVSSNDPDEPTVVVPVSLTIEPCLATMHVESIKLRAQGLGGGRYEVTAVLRIVDSDGGWVPGALVDAEWTLPGGMIRAQQAMTNAKGVAQFRLRARVSGTVQICVTGARKDGYVYDPGQNGETCDSLVLP